MKKISWKGIACSNQFRCRVLTNRLLHVNEFVPVPILPTFSELDKSAICSDPSNKGDGRENLCVELPDCKHKRYRLLVILPSVSLASKSNSGLGQELGQELFCTTTTNTTTQSKIQSIIQSTIQSVKNSILLQNQQNQQQKTTTYESECFTLDVTTGVFYASAPISFTEETKLTEGFVFGALLSENEFRAFPLYDNVKACDMFAGDGSVYNPESISERVFFLRKMKPKRFPFGISCPDVCSIKSIKDWVRYELLNPIPRLELETRLRELKVRVQTSPCVQERHALIH